MKCVFGSLQLFGLLFEILVMTTFSFNDLIAALFARLTVDC